MERRESCVRLALAYNAFIRSWPTVAERMLRGNRARRFADAKRQVSHVIFVMGILPLRILPYHRSNGNVSIISKMATTSDFPFNRDLLQHISPIEWRNVIIYGEIKIDPVKLRWRGPSVLRQRVFQHEFCYHPLFSRTELQTNP